MMITAETKTNKYGSAYTYYHCSKRGMAMKCPERAIGKGALEKQFAAFLSALSIPSRIEAWARKEAGNQAETIDHTQAALRRSCEAAIEEVAVQLRELNGLRLRRLMSDTEYVLERKRLENERSTLQESLRKTAAVNRLELFDEIISFSKQAVDWFWRADDAAKRLMVKTAGSNFFLKGKILSVEAVKPLQLNPLFGQILLGCSVVEDVGTFPDAPGHDGNRFLTDISDMLHDPQIALIVANIRMLRHQFEMEEQPHSVVGAKSA